MNFSVGTRIAKSRLIKKFHISDFYIIPAVAETIKLVFTLGQKN